MNNALVHFTEDEHAAARYDICVILRIILYTVYTIGNTVECSIVEQLVGSRLLMVVGCLTMNRPPACMILMMY